MDIIRKHMCDGTDEFTHIIYREIGEYWALIPDNREPNEVGSGGVPIVYCPFCGKKLSRSKMI